MKNLKKGLAVAMSLAMIATVMPMNVSAAADDEAAVAGTICKEAGITNEDSKACGEIVYLELLGKKVEDYTMEGEDITINDAVGTGKVTTDLFTAVKQFTVADEALEIFLKTATITEKAEVQKWTKAIAAIEKMFTASLDLANDAKTNDETEVVKFTGIVKTATDNMNKTADTTTTWNKTGFESETNGTTNLDAAKAALKAMNDFVKAGYNLNMTTTMQSVFDETRSSLEEEIMAHVGDTRPAELAKFVLGWEMVLKADLSNAKEQITTNSEKQALLTYIGLSTTASGISTSSKAQINARIKAIKGHDYYESFKDDEAVVAIIEAYQELIDSIDGTKDLTKTDSYKGYVTEKTDDANETAKAAINKLVTLATTATTDAAKAAAIAAGIDNEQFEALKAYKEDVLDEVYTMQTRKIGNFHINDSYDTNTAASTLVNTVKKNLPASIYTLVDTKDGLFGYDVIVEHMADFNEALDAITTDIEKITPANIKAADKAKLEAAEDAIYELTNERKGAFVGNLTDKEERSLRAAERKIENLREAYDNLGIASTTGWYDKGNGNWGYNNEDGTPATKWVAAGKLWYYVKGGDMLRNSWVAQDSTGKVWYYVNNAGEMVVSTTIDGYAINANGEWHK